MQRAAAKVREAWLAVQRADVPAPVSGTVARRSVQVGQRVQAGVPLMSVVTLDNAWVDANFKEGQLERLRIGQPATLEADVYGKHVVFHGKVEGLGAGTGAAFSLLPAQNATGNWIKVVQRVPVRISLDPKEIAQNPLRVGLSMNVTVDVADENGTLGRQSTPRTQAQGAVASTTVFDSLQHDADAEVARIIAANGGGRAEGAGQRRAAGAGGVRADGVGRRRTPVKVASRHRQAPPPQAIMSSPAPAARAPLKGGALVMGTLSLSLATFMNVLDSSIANVSLPSISGDLGVSISQGTWVITSFGVANAISVPLTGWLTQRFGAVRLFTASVILFVIASILCGLAPSIELLIAFRVLQGFVAGPMIPLSQTLLLSTYPPHEGRHRAGAVGRDHARRAGGRAAAGRLHHRQLDVAVDLLHQHPRGHLRRGRDVEHLQQARDAHRQAPDRRHRPGHAGAVGRLAADHAGQGQGARLVQLQHHRHAGHHRGDRARRVHRLGADRRRIRWSTSGCSRDATSCSARARWRSPTACSSATWCCCRCGCSSTWATRRPTAGMALAPVGVLAILLTPMVGKNVAKWDPRWMATGAFILFAVVLWMRSNFTSETDFGTILIPTLIQGGAMAFFFIPLTTLTLAGLPPERIPAAAGLSNFVRIMFGAMGTSIATTLWDNRATLHHARLVEQMGLNGTRARTARRPR